MALAVSAGAGSPENVAYVQTLLGNLELARGRPDRARAAYAQALAGLPSYLPAQAGLARVDAASGHLGSAIRRYQRVVARRPLPEYAIAIAEAELVAGRTEAARTDLDLVRAQARLLRSAGVNVDVEIALFEADHGDTAEAIRLAARALAAAPGVRSEDALGWALTRAGRPEEGLAHARRALRLGSADASFLYHAGIAARASGHDGLGVRWLRRALEHRAALSPYHALRAEKALR
jgi:tetratricopeptide (TPR) repeat protein